jgi:hypothetical protein
MFTTCAAGGILISERGFELSGVLSLEAAYRRAELGGLSWYEGSLRPDVAELGINYDATNYLRLRGAVDFANGVRLDELAVAADLPFGLSLLIGQFMPALGFEAEASPMALAAMEYSLMHGLLKPSDLYDVGVSLTWSPPGLFATMSILNGNGRPLGWGDDNEWKDLLARVLWFARPDLGLGVRGYLGRTGSEGALYRVVAAQALWRCGRWQLVAEGQNALIGSLLRDVGYIQLTRRLPSSLEVTSRVQLLSAREAGIDCSVAAVLGYRPLEDRIAILVGLDRWATFPRDPQQRASHWRAMGEIKVAL